MNIWLIRARYHLCTSPFCFQSISFYCQPTFTGDLRPEINLVWVYTQNLPIFNTIYQ